MAKIKEPSAMTGTFTRSRSEIFLHRTRSGSARPDPTRHATRLSKRLPAIDPPKDLRLKRIFSGRTASVSPDADPTADIDSPEKKTPTLDSDTSDLSKNGSVFTTDLGSGGNSTDSKGRTEVDRVEMNLEMESSNQTKIRLGLSRCSRSKLIGNQNSFSYRRLLPYLKGLVREDSSGMDIFRLNNHSINAENPIEDKLSFSHVDPLSNQQNHILPLEDSSTFCGQDQELVGNLKLTSQIDVLQTITVESGDSCSERKLGVELVTCNMNANDSEMEDINKLEMDANSDFEEHHQLNPQEVICQATSVESPVSNSYKKRKLQVYEDTCKADTNAYEMDDTNRLEKEEISEKMIGGNAEILIGCDDNVQGTPPDANLIGKLDAEGGKRSNLLESELCNTSKDRLVPALGSRLKLFRNPSSFSYRRLLPYIMDLSKDGSSGIILHPIDYTTKAEKNAEKRPYATKIDPSSASQHQAIPLLDSLIATSVVHQHSEENPDFELHCLNAQENIHDPVTMTSLNVSDESKMQINECKSDLPLERADYEFEIPYKSSSCSPTFGEDLSVQELAGNLQGLLHSPLKPDRKPLQGVSQFESSTQGCNRPLPPRKGILKKQIRGCRGICMCLDCTSFRVHAERGFEFSRKQMLQADEVAEGLMKELSCLRSMVERFVMPAADCSRTYNNLQLNQEQIRGVCQRTLRVEEAAKSRMREMILELNTHSRIPGPRVSFSEYVEKQNI